MLHEPLARLGIRIEPPNPRLGEKANAYFSTGGRDAYVDIPGRSRKRIRDGAALPLCFKDDQPIEIRMEDEDGALLASKTIKPVVAIPSLEGVELKPSVSYAEEVLNVRVAALDAERQLLRWRSAGAQWSDEVCCGKSGCFELPIPKFPTHLEIEIILESRDADVAESGRVRIKKTVTVTHPEPEIELFISSHSVPRHSSGQCVIRGLWIAKAEFGYDGSWQPLPLYPDRSIAFAMQVHTARIGTHLLNVRAVGLNGRVMEKSGKIQVTPRQPRVQTRTLADGSVEFCVDGCENVHLRIPANWKEISIAEPRGIIRHAFLMPTEAFLTYTTDDGITHQRRLVLDRFGSTLWKMSPLFSGHSAGDQS